ncbi:hypothetical protein BV20DRAFT_148517 [Pilatotrama ljubarskyi]|nr:hypothetical protein BV20DRAFT_148517 [Pilatotrama ljubarskyi]
MHVPRDVLPVQVSPRSIRLLWHRRSHPSSISGLRTEKRMAIIMACTVFSSNMHVPYIRWFRPSTRASSRPHPAQHDTQLKKRRDCTAGPAASVLRDSVRIATNHSAARNEERRARNRFLVPLSLAHTSLTLCSRRSHVYIPRACARPSPLDPHEAHHTIPPAGPALRFSCRAGMVKSAGEVQYALTCVDVESSMALLTYPAPMS